MESGIYKLYWNNCKYFYIGQSQNIKKRIFCHLSELKSGKHCNNKLIKIYNKYGVPVFEIIEKCEIDNLNSREQYYIDLYFGTEDCCNLSPSSENCRGVKMKPHVIEAARIRNKGRKASNETRAKMTASRIGKVLSNQSKTKISLSRTGVKRVNYSGILHKGYGKKRSPETIKKATISLKGLFAGEKNTFYGKTGDMCNRSKKCVNTETGIFYDSWRLAYFATESNKMSYTSFKQKLNGRVKTNNTPYVAF